MLKRFDAPEQSSSSCSSVESPACKRRRPLESSESEASDSASDKGLPRTKGTSELLLTHLSMFPGEEAKCESMAATNGKSKERIRNLLKSDTLCKCKKNCRKAVNFSLVFKLCCTFWSLSKAGQDCVLWGIQNMQTGMENTEDDNDSDGGSSSDYSGTSSGSDNAEQSSKLLNTWYIQGGANLEDELI